MQKRRDFDHSSLLEGIDVDYNKCIPKNGCQDGLFWLTDPPRFVQSRNRLFRLLSLGLQSVAVYPCFVHGYEPTHKLIWIVVELYLIFLLSCQMIAIVGDSEQTRHPFCESPFHNEIQSASFIPMKMMIWVISFSFRKKVLDEYTKSTFFISVKIHAVFFSQQLSNTN